MDAQNRISALCREIEAIAVSFGYDPYEWLMDGGEFGVDERAELAQLRNRSLDLQQALARAQEERDAARLEAFERARGEEEATQRYERAEAELAKVRAEHEAMRKDADIKERKLIAICRWLEYKQPDVFRRGLWDAINMAEITAQAAQPDEQSGEEK